MKNTLFITLIICCFVQRSISQNNKDVLAHIEANYKPIVPGKLYVSSCEISNAMYLEFVHELPAGVSESALPDSTGWNFKRFDRLWQESYNTPIINVYNWHPKYQDYPVVNITQALASAYCVWLTEKYNNTPGRKFKRVEFRLPTKAEWELAATGKMKDKNTRRIYPWDGFTMQDSKGKYLANYGVLEEGQIKRDGKGDLALKSDNLFTGGNIGADGYLYTAPCKAYPPNEFGLYNLSGNVSEYLNEIGKTKGGSFVSPAYYLQIKTDDSEFEHMEMGGPMIGFRPIMEVLER